jgi:hypothetical protein
VAARQRHRIETHVAQNRVLKGPWDTMYTNDESVISDTGLRYTSKTNGSPFQGMGSAGEMLSCIQCSKHRPRSKGLFKRYLNSQVFFCFDCKPPKAAS